ncbi:MAG: hypothetical protein Q8L88_11685 [Bacteroidota bacterium]|nr:hypothetical protein [Bacteroidota bacterium]
MIQQAWHFYSIFGSNTPMLASSFRRKPESTRWMPAYAGMTNTPQLAAEIFILKLGKNSNSDTFASLLENEEKCYCRKRL